MAKNLSVSQFQDLMARIPKQVASDLQTAPREAADTLAGAMRAAVPLGVDGRHELQESIRVEDGGKPFQTLVRAGGVLTTKEVRHGSAVHYDYANAIEFGTQKMSAEPFFWPTYRLLRSRLQSRIFAKARKAIEKIAPLS